MTEVRIFTPFGFDLGDKTLLRVSLILRSRYDSYLYSGSRLDPSIALVITHIIYNTTEYKNHVLAGKLNLLK